MKTDEELIRDVLWSRLDGDDHKAKGRREAIAARLRELSAGLEKYGQHKSDCDTQSVFVSGENRYSTHKCTCGFSKVRKGT